MKRDLYADVSARSELERGAAPWIKRWSATAGRNVPQNAVTNRPYSGTNVTAMARTQSWLGCALRFLTFKQALEAGGKVRKGEHGTKVYFVKQLQVKDDASTEAETRLVPMLREYTIFNIDQCEEPSRDHQIGKADARTQSRYPAMLEPTSSCVQPARTSAGDTGEAYVHPEPRLHLDARLRGIQGNGSLLQRRVP